MFRSQGVEDIKARAPVERCIRNFVGISGALLAWPSPVSNHYVQPNHYRGVLHSEALVVSAGRFDRQAILLL